MQRRLTEHRPLADFLGVLHPGPIVLPSNARRIPNK